MLKEYLKSLADVFRSVLGTTEKINAQDFTSKINEVYEKGKSEGGDTEEIYNNGFEDGKEFAWDEFWDSYQDKGGKTDYTFAFAGYGWNDKTFKPKYDITAYSGANILSNNRITDFVARLNEAGVAFDTSKNAVTSYLMQGNMHTTTLPILDMRSRKNIAYFISANTALKSIEKVILKADGSQTFNDYSFNGNTALEEIRFEGTIGHSVSFKESSKLTHDSLMNIINCLATVTTTQTLTLHADSKAKLTDAEKAIATEKGWTIA